jgi:hypothetical protein
MLTFASLAGLSASFTANSTTILALWLVFEQYLAGNPKIKANSTFQLVSGLIKAALKRGK